MFGNHETASRKTARDFTVGQRVAIARQARTWVPADQGVVLAVDTANNQVKVAVVAKGRTREVNYWPGYLAAI